MKYIRTIDGCITKGNFKIGEAILTLYGEEQITEENTADTIEELCDEFVIKMSKEHYVSKRSLLELRDMNNYVGCIYGAIWTDKGLIYVAKMNEKGELELL